MNELQKNTTFAPKTRKPFKMSKQTGKITQIIGPVVDVRFDLEGGKLPNILDALEIVRSTGQK